MIELGELHLESAVMNAAGPWSVDRIQIDDLNESYSGAIITKTVTLRPSRGNINPTIFFENDSSINNLGMPNPGVENMVKNIRKLDERKTTILSIYGRTPEEFSAIVEVADPHVDGYEINGSCRNINKTLEEDAVLLNECLGAVLEKTTKPVGLKVQPVESAQNGHNNYKRFTKTAGIIATNGLNHVVASNTLGAQSLEDQKGNMHYGSLGGKLLRPYSLLTVELYRDATPMTPIVGCGGIVTVEDVKEYLNRGCVAVQVGTAILTHGIEVIDSLVQQLAFV